MSRGKIEISTDMLILIGIGIIIFMLMQRRNYFPYLPPPSQNPYLPPPDYYSGYLSKLTSLESSKVPGGMYQSDFTVTTNVLDFPPNPPWISFFVDNDGPGNLTIWVNSADKPMNVRGVPAGQQLKIDMGYPIIQHVYMQSTSTSTVHIYANEGSR